MFERSAPAFCGPEDVLSSQQWAGKIRRMVAPMFEGAPAHLRHVLVRAKLMAPASKEVAEPEERSVSALLGMVVRRYPAVHHQERTLTYLRAGTTFASASRETLV
ncbi:hypothetical protein GGI04_001018 [Coemansia thaxteri]|uniref:Uncharacterized protein n=1 Tax=Coemansia thaxteri TaxID=2663907 RepID=A0A9W8BJB5_9FUNG|nr:hypothetical protein H4R26_000084 [Coemansia thaxteri]KAJ2008745.1 hypothetical protein GGI04_001018 [Coemansia thaxteri]KAJ2472221.1 hypothetical protein GGI02_001724 [Coemansia sp. RSA 2322]KAJ2488145.1 hypothetical protein EV174_000109 [Coemansia sp. RSA 2320]